MCYHLVLSVFILPLNYLFIYLFLCLIFCCAICLFIFLPSHSFPLFLPSHYTNLSFCFPPYLLPLCFYLEKCRPPMDIDKAWHVKLK